MTDITKGSVPPVSRRPLIAPVNRTLLRRARRWPIIPALIIFLLIVSAVFGSLLAPYDPIRGVLTDRLIPPAWEEGGSTDHLLGTDPLGRDILSRVIHGARVSLLAASIVLVAGGIGGTLLGMFSGWAGGWWDEIIQRFVEVTIAVPFIMVALVAVIVFGQSMSLIVILLIVFSWTSFVRQVRGETLQLRSMDYVVFAQVAGASSYRILIRHLLPGVFNTVMILASLQIGGLIITESVLSYLGVGIPPPTPAWGVMVSEGSSYITLAWWVAFFPGLAIFLTVLAFNFMGDWLRDKLDPRLRQLQ